MVTSSAWFETAASPSSVDALWRPGGERSTQAVDPRVADGASLLPNGIQWFDCELLHTTIASWSSRWSSTAWQQCCCCCGWRPVFVTG